MIEFGILQGYIVSSEVEVGCEKKSKSTITVIDELHVFIGPVSIRSDGPDQYAGISFILEESHHSPPELILCDVYRIHS